MLALFCFVAGLAHASGLPAPAPIPPPARAEVADAPEPPAASTVQVEVLNGGLLQAAMILQARFDTPIHYEGALRNIEGVHFVRKPSPQPSFFSDVVMLGEGGFVFRCPEDATPRQALDAAVAAYNALPEGYVRYAVRDADGALDLVPVEVWDGTAWKASTPLLDTVVTLPSTTGEGNDLLDMLMKALSEASGMPVECDTGTSFGCPSLADPWHDPPIRIPSATGPARTLLNEIISRSDLVSTWRLLWYQHPQESSWLIQPSLIRPIEGTYLNRTTLILPSTPR